VYFAHTYCAWERATNENTNGLLRQFLPKKTDFRSRTQTQLDIIAHRLNNRPRKRLDYRTPCEAFEKAIVALRERIYLVHNVFYTLAVTALHKAMKPEPRETLQN